MKHVMDMTKMAVMTVLLIVPTIVLLMAYGILELARCICHKLNNRHMREEDIVIESREVNIDELFANDPEFLAQLKAAEEKETA